MVGDREFTKFGIFHKNYRIMTNMTVKKTMQEENRLSRGLTKAKNMHVQNG